jgi:putative FmdB family regulatory protein
MPLYEYKCPNCHGVTEKLISHSADEEEKRVQKCPECGGKAERVISLSSLDFKGDWFATKGKY